MQRTPSSTNSRMAARVACSSIGSISLPSNFSLPGTSRTKSRGTKRGGFTLNAIDAAKALARKYPALSEETLTTGMLGFVAFTLAVTIGIAQDRFETRRRATLDEANTIGTAWLRMGLADAPGRPIARLIEEYARARLAYLEAPSPDAATAALAHANTLQNEIWQSTLPLLPAIPAPLASQLVSSLNDMFDAELVQRY